MSKLTRSAMEPDCGCWCMEEITRVLRPIVVAIAIRIVPCSPEDATRICDEIIRESVGRQEKCDILIETCINKIHCGFFWSYDEPYVPETWFGTPFEDENLTATVDTSLFEKAFLEIRNSQQTQPAKSPAVLSSELGACHDLVAAWLLPERERIALAMTECSTRHRTMDSVVELYRRSYPQDQVDAKTLTELLDMNMARIESFLATPGRLIPQVVLEAAHAALNLEDWVRNKLAAEKFKAWPHLLLSKSSVTTSQLNYELDLLRQQIFGSL